MGVKRYKAADGKPAWYDEDKHDLEDGKLVLKSGYKVENKPSTLPAEEPKPAKKSRRKKLY